MKWPFVSSQEDFPGMAKLQHKLSPAEMKKAKQTKSEMKKLKDSTNTEKNTRRSTTSAVQLDGSIDDDKDDEEDDIHSVQAHSTYEKAVEILKSHVMAPENIEDPSEELKAKILNKMITIAQEDDMLTEFCEWFGIIRDGDTVKLKEFAEVITFKFFLTS